MQYFYMVHGIVYFFHDVSYTFDSSSIAVVAIVRSYVCK